MKYPHRPNHDGSVDAICPHCMITIASARQEGDLSLAEATHTCDPELVAYYKKLLVSERRKDLGELLARCWEHVRSARVRPEPVYNRSRRSRTSVNLRRAAGIR